MKVAYVDMFDRTESGSWPIISRYMARSLREQGIETEHIGSLEEKYLLLSRLKYHFYKRVFKKNYLINRSPLILKGYAAQVSKKLSRLDADVVFSVGALTVAYLECKQPIAFWGDAAFAGLVNFYPGLDNFCKETVRDGYETERSALERCKLAIYASEWAARTIREHYRIDPSKIKVVPFGANIEHDMTYDDIKRIIESRPSDKCRLLFIGMDWARKGGDIAFEVASSLAGSGLKTELTIAGCRPELREPLPGFVKNIGFIDRTSETGDCCMKKLLAESHFLILPARAEAFGIALCEANAFGVPCIATNVGGIPTIIKDGVNGKLFSKDAAISEYCAYISGLFSDRNKYNELAASSFNEYQTRLNWAVSGQAVKRLLEEVVR